jgi:hypothetical protein
MGKSKRPVEKDRYSKPKARLITRDEQARKQFEEDERERERARQAAFNKMPPDRKEDIDN